MPTKIDFGFGSIYFSDIVGFGADAIADALNFLELDLAQEAVQFVSDVWQTQILPAAINFIDSYLAEEGDDSGPVNEAINDAGDLAYSLLILNSNPLFAFTNNFDIFPINPDSDLAILSLPYGDVSASGFGIPPEDGLGNKFLRTDTDDKDIEIEFFELNIGELIYPLWKDNFSLSSYVPVLVEQIVDSVGDLFSDDEENPDAAAPWFVDFIGELLSTATGLALGYGYNPTQNKINDWVANDWGTIFLNQEEFYIEHNDEEAMLYEKNLLKGRSTQDLINHEISHTLGLVHPGNYNNSADGENTTFWDGPVLPSIDKLIESSYNDWFGLEAESRGDITNENLRQIAKMGGNYFDLLNSLLSHSNLQSGFSQQSILGHDNDRWSAGSYLASSLMKSRPNISNSLDPNYTISEISRRAIGTATPAASTQFLRNIKPETEYSINNILAPDESRVNDQGELIITTDYGEVKIAQSIPGDAYTVSYTVDQENRIIGVKDSIILLSFEDGYKEELNFKMYAHQESDENNSISTLSYWNHSDEDKRLFDDPNIFSPQPLETEDGFRIAGSHGYLHIRPDSSGSY